MAVEDDDRDRTPRDDGEPPRRRRPRDDVDFDDEPRPPKRGGTGVIVFVIIGVLLFVVVLCGVIVVGLLWPAVSKVREASSRMKNTNNMKQIGLGILNYDSTNAQLPNNSYNAKGEPLLSWRVHILPFVEQEALYRQFKLDEPWDGPNNKRLLTQMPPVYLNVSRQEPGATVTHFRGFSHPGAIFAKPNPAILQTANNAPRGVPLRLIMDKPENTIFVVEANDPVDWTKPDDLDGSVGKPFPTLGSEKAPTFIALFGDASVRSIRRTLNETMLRNGTTIADGNAVNFD